MGTTYLVVIIEVNPTTKPLHRLTPLSSICHDNRPALFIVLFNSNFLNSLQTRHPQLLVDFIFDRYTVGIPAKSPLNKMALHRPVPGNDVLYRRGQQVPIVRKTCCEWGSIVKGIRLTALRKLDLPSKGVDLSPSLEDNLLLSRKINRHEGYCCSFNRNLRGRGGQ